MTKIISFYSVAPSQGKRTLSHAFAQVLAEHKHRTLYVELDVYHPSLAVSNQIIHPFKNVLEYFQDTITENDFNLEPYILKHEDLLDTENRELKKVFSEFPSILDHLTLPPNFHINSFPDLFTGEGSPEDQAHEIIQKFIYALTTLKYHYVVVNLPNEIESIFGYEMIEGSDEVINVVTPSASRLMENRNNVEFLSKNIPSLEDKWATIINMASPYIEEAEVKQLIKGDSMVVNYDPERQQSEYSLEIGSKAINEKMEMLANKLDISVVLTPPKKKFSLLNR